MKRNYSNKITLAIALAVLIIGGISCKSNKKMADVSNKEATQEATADKTQMEDEDEKITEDEAEQETNEESSFDLKTKTKYKLADYFEAIASAPSVTSANKSIQEALNLFDTPETLVLIVISEVNGKKDYDRPTNAKEYLNYLKDQKKNINRISSIKLNDSGKITEVELTKK